MIAADYFCGAGGASRGLHDAGYDVVGFDHWPVAVATHNANRLTAYVRDLSDPAHDPEYARLGADLAWFSSPCQPFSAAGDGEGEFDGRDGFPWALRILAATLPAVAIFENVKGLTFSKHAGYLATVLDGIRRCGYRLDWNVLNCADYGVPQTRERCIIIARRDNGPIVWPTVTHTEQPGMFTEQRVSMADALGWSGELHYRRGAGMIERHGERGPWATDVIPAPTLHANSAKDWLVTAGRDANATTRTIDQPAPTVLARKDANAWTLHTNVGQADDGTRQTRPVTEPVPTISCKSDGQWTVEPGAIRLTIPELARLQDFPDDWQWCGTKTDQARQIGNAVPRTLARLLAEANRPQPTESPLT